MTFDVIIVGGGPAGCAAALSLIKSNPAFTFLLIDDADPATFKIGESLPPEAKRILQYLSPSLPLRLSQPTHIPCTGNASIWESPDLRETHGMMNPFGYGWHLDRATFDQGMRDAIVDARPNGILKAKFAGASKEDGTWVVKVDGDSDAKEYRSQWLVDASGRKASVAQKLGAKTVKLDDVLAFYVLYTSSSSSPDLDHRTIIEAVPSGWFYSSQLPNRRRLVVFHTSGSASAAKLVRRLPGFLDHFDEFSTVIKTIIEENEYHVEDDTGGWPRATAAGSSHLEPFGDEVAKWCAVGDAAMAFDPLSSQGMITALKSGCAVGIMLSKQLTGTGDMKSVEAVYDDVKQDYVKKRTYFYAQAMFDGEEFWQKQKSS